MPPKRVSSDVEELFARLEDLERRVSALEARHEVSPLDEETPATAATARLTRGEAAAQQPSLLMLMGRAILGIAGAYLLRAIAESGAVPAWMGVTLGLTYAAAWLIWAGWRGRGATLAGTFHALTSALILAPIAWEATVRFGMLAPPVTAAVLAGYAVLAMILAWRYAATPVLWVGVLAAILTAGALMPVTRALLPFAWAILAVAGANESLADGRRWRGLRMVTATAADLGVVIVLIILGDRQAVPAEYSPAGVEALIALVAALFAIYAVSVVRRSLFLRLDVTKMDAAQFAATLLLAVWGVARITNGTGLAALGVSCLVAGAGSYLVTFSEFRRDRAGRNFRFHAGCALVLVATGSFLALPHAPLAIWLCATALAGTWAGVRLRNAALGLHGVVYLGGAVYASGLLAYSRNTLGGAYPGAPGALALVAVAVTLSCAVLIFRLGGELPRGRIFRVALGMLTVYALAPLVVFALVRLTAGGAVPGPRRLAIIRTVVTCAAALLLSHLGARLQRVELVWLAYAAAALGSLKLVFEEMQLGSTGTLAASLAIYGAVLILIPRLARAGARGA